MSFIDSCGFANTEMTVKETREIQDSGVLYFSSGKERKIARCGGVHLYLARGRLRQ